MAKIAVVKTGGKQYKIKEKQIFKVEKLPVEEGESFNFDEVLLVADEDGTAIKIGDPIVSGAQVKGTVIKQDRSRKITVIKYKAKTRYKRKKGHRQAYSQVRVDEIKA